MTVLLKISFRSWKKNCVDNVKSNKINEGFWTISQLASYQLFIHWKCDDLYCHICMRKQNKKKIVFIHITTVIDGYTITSHCFNLLRFWQLASNHFCEKTIETESIWTIVYSEKIWKIDYLFWYEFTISKKINPFFIES